MAPRPQQPTATRRSRRLDAVLVLAVLLAGLALTAARWPSNHSPATDAELSAMASTQPVDVAKGRQVYARDCAYCHGGSGQGTANGPELTHSGTAYVDFMLTTGRMPLRGGQQLELGPQGYPRNQVPRQSPAYPPDVIRDIVQYAATFIKSGPAVPVVEPGRLPRGRDLFLTDCAPCHSASGTGMILPAGAFAPELYPDTSRQIAEALRIGPGPMPPFSSSQLDQGDVNDVVSYVRDLGDNQAIGGHPLDFFGPIAEGIVAWLIPIPLLIVFIRLLGKKAP